MSKQNFEVTVDVNNSADQVFAAINNVRGWWSEEIEGSTDKLNEVYFYHFKDVHRCTIKVAELIPGKRVVWEVLDNYFSFTEDKSEWIGNKIVFDIYDPGDKTQLTFSHVGLIPQYECYAVCEEAWTNYITNSLRKLIETGKGEPNPKEGEGYNPELAEKFNIGQE